MCDKISVKGHSDSEGRMSDNMFITWVFKISPIDDHPALDSANEVSTKGKTRIV